MVNYFSEYDESLCMICGF